MHSTPSFQKPDYPDLSPVSEASVGAGDPLVTALEALEGNEHDASKWLEVAQAFRAAGQPTQAIDACEACLKLDPKQVHGWLLIAELAEAVGHKEMADDAYDVVRKLTSGDSSFPVTSSGS